MQMSGSNDKVQTLHHILISRCIAISFMVLIGAMLVIAFLVLVVQLVLEQSCIFWCVLVLKYIFFVCVV